MNIITLIGRIGKEPESRTFGESMVVNASLAVSEKRKDKKTGEQREKTTWFNLTIWGKPGEIFKQYVHKGDKIALTGKIETDQYEDNDGHKRQNWFVNVNSFEFIESKKSDQPKQDPQREEQPVSDNGDLPF